MKSGMEEECEAGEKGGVGGEGSEYAWCVWLWVWLGKKLDVAKIWGQNTTYVGELHSLVLDCTPVPQLWLQCPHSPHSPHPPSTLSTTILCSTHTPW